MLALTRQHTYIATCQPSQQLFTRERSMPTRNQGVGSVIPQTKVDFDRALTIYQNLKSALAIARGDWGSGGERDWSADAEALLKTAADLKLD